MPCLRPDGALRLRLPAPESLQEEDRMERRRTLGPDRKTQKPKELADPGPQGSPDPEEEDVRQEAGGSGQSL